MPAGEPLLGRRTGRGPRDDPSLLVALGVASRGRPPGLRVRPGGQFAPQPVIDAEQGLDDEVRKVVDDVNRPPPGGPVHLQIGAVPIARPGRLHQGYLHHRQRSTTPEAIATGLRSVPCRCTATSPPSSAEPPATRRAGSAACTTRSPIRRRRSPAR